MEDEEYKKLAVEERCIHDLWRARVNAYEELSKLFRQIDDEKSPEFGKYLGLVKKFVTDPHAVGQEKGLEATLAYVENYAYAGKTVSEVMSGIVSKCIAASKTRTRELALQITLMYIEIEKQDFVVEELVKGMDQKNPKIVAGSISASTQALKKYGSKVVTVKPLIKKISPLFSNRDKTVRDEARLMVIEIFRWIGPALRSQLNGLQPVQITELETEFSKLEGQKAVPLGYVRSQQQKQIALANEQEEGTAGESEHDIEEEDAVQVDPYDLADPVDILSKLPKDFYEKIEAKKWQERKEVLEVVETLVKTPKLQNGEYGDLVRALKKIVEKDSNVVVVALAGKCLAGLASGLKKRFQTYAGACIPSLLEKFKEKKQNVVTALKEAVDAIYLTTSIESIVDDVIEALANKNPSVKTETAMFLARCFSRTQPTALNKKILKLLITALLKNINESDPAVRDASAEALGTLMKLVGEKAVTPFLVELEKDNLKMSKIRECCDKAVITVKATGTKKERPTTAPVKTAAPAKSAKLPGQPKSAPSSQPMTRKKTESSSRTATVVKSRSKTAVKAPAKAVEREISEVEADELVNAILSENISADLADANWKTRMAAVEQILKEIQVLEAKELPTQALVMLLTKKPGLKETNFQVLKVKCDIIKYLADNANFSSTSSKLCINEIADKFGDAKNGNSACEAMTSMSAAAGLPHVSSHVMDYAFNQKNPKVMQETFLWLSGAIKEFGFSNLDAKLFLDNVKKALGSTNPAVRQASITFCGVLYLYMGAALYVYFENEKPALRDQIMAEFAKYEGQKPPAPTRAVPKSASSNSLDASEDESGEPTAENTVPSIQDLLPRIDISNQITEALVNEMDDKNWKVRNEALIKVSTILQEAKFIKPNIGDLPQALAKRLSDSNTKIAQTALTICEAIAKAMGAPSKQYIKVFFPFFLQSLGDTKAWMRTAARETMETYWEQCGHKEFFENEMIADALKSGSPTLRTELWEWLGEKLPKIPNKSVTKEELVACIPHLYTNLEDRNSEVRKNAQEATLGFMIHLGYESMVKQTEKLKPASVKSVVAALEKVRPNLPVKPLPKKSLAEKEEKSVRGTKPVANSKNAVKSKGSATSTKANPVSSSRKKDEDIDFSPLLVVNNLKHQRTIDESKLKVLKWNFTAPREEFYELLKDQMSAASVNKTLMSNMFHMDFRYHIKAIESLMDDLSDNGPALIANLDLILKWLTLRFFDTNPSVLLKGLEYLHLVFNMLIEHKYHMLESEASSFLPYLILKIGDPKDSVRNGVRSLLKQICNVYPVSRLFTYIMEGLKSKNARQRAECLDAMGTIILDYGMSVSPGSCLKEVAKQISDRDNSVRNAALNCVVQAYNIVGEKVYKMVGNISDKDLSLLEERIKRSSKKLATKPSKSDINISVPSLLPEKEVEQVTTPEMETANNDNEENDEDDDDFPPIIPPKMVQPVVEPIGPFKLDADLLDKLDRLKPVYSLPIVQEFDLDFLKDDIQMPSTLTAAIKAKSVPLSPPKPLDPNVWLSRRNLSGPKAQGSSTKKDDSFLVSTIDQVSSADIFVAMKNIEMLSGYLQSPQGPNMAEYENEFMSAITAQLRHLRNQDPKSDHNTLKVYRNVLTVMDSFYHNKNLGKQISADVLKNIINELIHILVDGRIESCPNGDSYVRVINLHCVKIIEKSNHTRIICALIMLIHECIRNDVFARHTDLVMKCLWRVIKLMPTWEQDVDYDYVLLEIHNFLKEFPSTWWKMKQIDTPIRTIKTILHSGVKIKGGSIMLHLGKIPNTSESEVETYILKLLKTMNVEAVKPPPTRVPLSRAVHNMLTEIFQKIGSKDETKLGLNLLFDFMQQHPEADIDPFLKKSSKFFQDYIKNGLREIRLAREAERLTIDKVNNENIPETINEMPQQSDEQKDPEYWKNRLAMWQGVRLKEPLSE